MARPTKFTSQRRAAIIALVRAGASLREAARRVDVDHATLLGWLRKGRTGHPSGRWHEFYLEVAAARADGPELVELRRRFDEASPEWLQKYLERTEWRPPDLLAGERARPHSTQQVADPGIEVVVLLSDGSPFEGRPLHEEPT